MWSLFSFNGGVIHLLNFVDVITKYEWVKPLKDKKAKVKESKCIPNKFLVDQGK